MSVDAREVIELRDDLYNILQTRDEVLSAVSKELSARLLRAVKLRTPVGKGIRVTVEKVDGKAKITKTKINGGTLKRGWSVDSKPQFFGNTCIIKIGNNIFYATYVEHGHRQTPGRYVPSIGKRLKSGWAKGKHMLELSVEELQENANGIVEKKINTWLNGVMT